MRGKLSIDCRAHGRTTLAAVMWLGLLAFAGYVYLGGVVREVSHRSGINAVKGMGGRCSTEPSRSGRDMRDDHVDTVTFPQANPESFDELGQLQRFPRLRTVHFNNSTITDSDLRCLRDLEQLTFLDVGETGIGDEGFREIGTLTRLETLDARETNVTDAGLNHLAACRSLKELYVDGCHI